MRSAANKALDSLQPALVPVPRHWLLTNLVNGQEVLRKGKALLPL